MKAWMDLDPEERYERLRRKFKKAGAGEWWKDYGRQSMGLAPLDLPGNAVDLGLIRQRRRK